MSCPNSTVSPVQTRSAQPSRKATVPPPYACWRRTCHSFRLATATARHRCTLRRKRRMPNLWKAVKEVPMCVSRICMA